jgi:hypothetical protein
LRDERMNVRIRAPSCDSHGSRDHRDYDGGQAEHDSHVPTIAVSAYSNLAWASVLSPEAQLPDA